MNTFTHLRRRKSRAPRDDRLSVEDIHIHIHMYICIYIQAFGARPEEGCGSKVNLKMKEARTDRLFSLDMPHDLLFSFSK